MNSKIMKNYCFLKMPQLFSDLEIYFSSFFSVLLLTNFIEGED